MHERYGLYNYRTITNQYVILNSITQGLANFFLYEAR